MPQNIHFQNIIVDRVEIKVGSFPGGVLVIGRILNRGEIVNIHIIGHNNNPRRVLTGRPFDPSCALGETVLLSSPELNIVIPLESLNITIGSLIGHRSNRPGPENVLLADQYLHVVVGDWLVVSGEVQVDIRHLVSFESQEGLERNIVTVLHQQGPTLRALLLWQVKAGAVFPFRVEVGKLALRTAVVRWQRVDLGNPRQGCNHTRTN